MAALGWGRLATAGVIDTGAADLDLRRCAVLHNIDQRLSTKASQADEQLQLLRLVRGHHEYDYYDKALAVFALVQHCGEDQSRLGEANRLLRFASFNAFPAQSGGRVFFGSTSAAWRHRPLHQALRLYFLYRDQLDGDVRDEFERRLSWMAHGFTATSEYTENINLMVNAAGLLAREASGQTGDAAYLAERDWLVEALGDVGRHGFWEWGSGYGLFVTAPLLNLADFAVDPAVKREARLAMDYLLAEVAEFSLGTYFGSARVRSYAQWTLTDWTNPFTLYAEATFGDSSVSAAPAEFLVTNYTPLVVHRALFLDDAPRESWSRQESSETLDRDGQPAGHNYWFRREHGFSLSVNQRPGPVGVSAHNFVTVYVQSAASRNARVVSWAFPSNVPWDKVNGFGERAYGLKNVAFMVNGGSFFELGHPETQVRGVPAGIFASADFSSRDLDGCWAFLSDGTTYVAWTPTQGQPVLGTATTWGGHIQSTYKSPGARGEVSLLEVGDAETYGSFGEFRESVKSRLGGDCPRWHGDQVSWITRDGDGVVFSGDGVAVNGAAVSDADYPRFSSAQLDGFDLVTADQALHFDFDTGALSGAVERLPSAFRWGTP